MRSETRGHLLALDTSTLQAAIVVCRADGSDFQAPDSDPTQRHGRGLVPAIGAALAAASLRVSDLGGIAVGLGPGSFTGLRVGVMTAKTLAYAAGIPIIGFDSLEWIARDAPDEEIHIHVIVDAQRGELFSAEFGRDRPGGPLVRRTPTVIEPISAWLGRLSATSLVLGPGLERLRPSLLPATPRTLNPARGATLGPFARELWAGGRRDDFWTIEPAYLRRSAAEEKRTTDRDMKK